MKAKVSVIIPVYKVEKFIEKCARSLFEQTLQEIEYLFIDDCTPDSSITILNKVLDEYPTRKQQVVIHKMDNNSGQAKVREWGMNHASGEYVIHCDSDDWVDSNIYEELYNKAVESDSDVVICGYYLTDGVDCLKEYVVSQNDKNSHISLMLQQKETWALWNKLIKRSLLSDIRYPIYSMGEDSVLSIQFLSLCHHIESVSEPFYFYFVNNNSITRTTNIQTWHKSWVESYKNAQFAIELLKEKGMDSLFAKEISFFKYKQKKMAGSLVWKRCYMKEWLSLFPEVHTKVLTLPQLSVKEKMKFYIQLIWVYLNSIFNTLS